MFVPGPQLSPKLQIVKLEQFLIELEEIDEPIVGGVAVFGPAAAYALFSEYGFASGPGPRTKWGVNPLGARAIMSRQAPRGYIAIHEDEMWPIFVEELAKVNWAANSSTQLRLRIEVAIDNADQRIAQIISESAPVDSGDLRTGIDIVDSSNASGLLDVEDLASSEAGHTFFL